MGDRFGIFGTVIKIRKLSLLLVVMLRIPNRCHSFPEAICDFGASVNIMPKVIYQKILNDPLLYTNMCLQLVDQSICYPEGVLEEVVIRVGQ